GPLAKSSKADWRIMVIDPVSREAFHRSVREQEKAFKDKCPEAFKVGPRHFDLFDRDDVRTVYLRKQLPVEVDATWTALESWPDNFRVKYCRVAPMCFLAAIDDQHIFVEQYHYGTGDRAGET